METWKLGALSNHPDTDASAAKYAGDLIAQNPRHYRAVIWAMERGYEFDRDKVRSALATLVEDRETDLDAVIAIINLAALADDHSEVRSLLEKFRDRFEKLQVISIWRSLMAQVLTHLGEEPEVSRLLGEESAAEVKAWRHWTTLPARCPGPRINYRHRSRRN